MSGEQGHSGQFGWVHWLRVLAAVSVVAVHVCAKDYTEHPVTGSAWQTMAVIEVLLRWSVPVFVMISGALLLDPARELPLKKLFGKYFLRILTALIVWSLGFAVLYIGLYLREGLPEILEYARVGHPHLWYLYMLLGLYLVTPLLRALARERALLRYFTVLAGVFALLLPTLGQFGLLPLTRYFAGRLEVHLVLGYTGYFVLGRLLATAETTRPQRLALYVLALLATIAAALIDGLGSLARGEIYTPFVSEFSPNAALQASALFLLLRECCRGRETPRLIRALSGLSFGIYLLHPVPIDLLRRFCGLGTLTVHPLLSVPLITLLSVAFSAAVTAVMKKIPILKNLV